MSASSTMFRVICEGFCFYWPAEHGADLALVPCGLDRVSTLPKVVVLDSCDWDGRLVESRSNFIHTSASKLPRQRNGDERQSARLLMHTTTKLGRKKAELAASKATKLGVSQRQSVSRTMTPTIRKGRHDAEAQARHIKTPRHHQDAPRRKA